MKEIPTLKDNHPLKKELELESAWLRFKSGESMPKLDFDSASQLVTLRCMLDMKQKQPIAIKELNKMTRAENGLNNQMMDLFNAWVQDGMKKDGFYMGHQMAQVYDQ